MTDLRDLLAGIPDCPCGKTHSCSTAVVEIGADILPKIHAHCANYRRVLLVADQNTYRAFGGLVEETLKEKLSGRTVYQTGDMPLIPNEKTLETLDRAVTKDTDLIVGVGSGVINDVCKYTAYQKDLPYFIVATAPSMDGFTSDGAALILGGMKVTLPARPPKAVFSDAGVLKSAPLELIQAGVGDILGKYSCLNDWKLSALINREYFCQKVYDLVFDAAETVNRLAEKAVGRDESALCELMKALIAVGFYMSYVGNSRPASGSEHHLSHFFEITGILENKPCLSHGIDVIYSALAVAKLRKKLILSEPKPYRHDRKEWEKQIRRIYLSSADKVIKLQAKAGRYDQDDYKTILANRQSIQEILAQAPDEDEILDMIKRIGLDYNEFLKTYGEEKIKDALLYAKDLKDRYTVLWLSFLHFQDVL